MFYTFKAQKESRRDNKDGYYDGPQSCQETQPNNGGGL